MSLADRPREKMRGRGCRVLTDTELVAVLLGSGMRGASAMAVAQNILAAVDYDLHALARLELSQFLIHAGVGETKALRIMAALELGRRRDRALGVTKPAILCGLDVYRIMRPIIADLPHEELHVLCLNRANEMLGHHRVSAGGTTATTADAKVIFRKALSHPRVTAIALAHNHPSGKARPSEADIRLTRKLARSAEYLDLNLLDHVIIGGQDYFSFLDEDLMDEGVNY